MGPKNGAGEALGDRAPSQGELLIALLNGLFGFG